MATDMGLIKVLDAVKAQVLMLATVLLLEQPQDQLKLMVPVLPLHHPQLK